MQCSIIINVEIITPGSCITPAYLANDIPQVSRVGIHINPGFHTHLITWKIQTGIVRYFNIITTAIQHKRRVTCYGLDGCGPYTKVTVKYCDLITELQIIAEICCVDHDGIWQASGFYRDKMAFITHTVRT